MLHLQSTTQIRRRDSPPRPQNWDITETPMSSALMASQTLVLQNPTLLSSHNLGDLSPPSTPNNHLRRRRLHSPLKPPFSLSLRNPKISSIFASSSRVLPNPYAKTSQNQAPSHSLLKGSTRTLTTLFAISLTASKFVAHKIFEALQLKGFHDLQQSLIHSAGPAFFAAIRSQPTGTLNTPFAVIAVGMKKWLDIYSGVLMVRVLLSWFPNIPWEKQPLSAIRDLCDPYLNLFRNIIPPIFDTLDVSPLLAFAVLGTLGSILNSSVGGY